MSNCDALELNSTSLSSETISEETDGDNKTQTQSNAKCLGVTVCESCRQPIRSQYLLRVSDRSWHPWCLRCYACGRRLQQKCYSRGGGPFYCRTHFYSRFGVLCAGCGEGMASNEVVRRAKELVYHMNCFRCVVCDRVMETGNQFFMLTNRKLICRHDYEKYTETEGFGYHRNDTDTVSISTGKRSRTNISTAQLGLLQSAFRACPKPTRQVRKRLSKSTGLDNRVIQVWFQNRRAKAKKLRADSRKTCSKTDHSDVTGNVNVKYGSICEQYKHVQSAKNRAEIFDNSKKIQNGGHFFNASGSLPSHCRDRRRLICDSEHTFENKEVAAVLETPGYYSMSSEKVSATTEYMTHAGASPDFHNMFALELESTKHRDYSLPVTEFDVDIDQWRHTRSDFRQSVNDVCDTLGASSNYNEHNFAPHSTESMTSLPEPLIPDNFVLTPTSITSSTDASDMMSPQSNAQSLDNQSPVGRSNEVYLTAQLLRQCRDTCDVAHDNTLDDIRYDHDAKGNALYNDHVHDDTRYDAHVNDDVRYNDHVIQADGAVVSDDEVGTLPDSDSSLDWASSWMFASENPFLSPGECPPNVSMETLIHPELRTADVI